jgi:Domain of unknown function (DUF4178)
MDEADPAIPTGEEPQASEPAKRKPKAFACKNCGSSITLRAAGHTLTAVCQSCSSLIDVSDENYAIVQQSNEATRATFLEPGQRGKLGDVLWEIIGYMEKSDETRVYRWHEYLLFNPFQGFRFLVQSNGHWTLFKVSREAFAHYGATGETEFDGRSYKLFLRGKSIVLYVKGEFYWRVKTGDMAFVADYIAPPFMLSTEESNGEIRVAVGEYIEPSVVLAAFPPNKNDDLHFSSGMYRTGVAPNQPGPYQNQLSLFWKVAGIALAAAIALQFYFSARANQTEVFKADYDIAAAQKDQTLSSPVFNLPFTGSVLFKTRAELDNDWLELGLTLANEDGSAEYAIIQGVEYYSGFDSDGTWTEGSRSESTLMSNVPAGNYRLLIDADAGAFEKQQPARFTLGVIHDVPSWWNLLIYALLVLIFPIYALVRRYFFESSRWAESDFAPVGLGASESDDDE